MNAAPLSLQEAKKLMGRMVKNRNASDFRLVGSNGSHFVMETRPVRAKNGVACDMTIMHGRIMGRAKSIRGIRPTVTINPTPRVL